MEAERHAHRRLPYEHASPGVLITGTRPLEDATADTRFEDDSRGLVLELTRIGDDGGGGGGPPHAEVGGEKSESLFWRACHRYCLHDGLDRH
jgi:hypothetical protein